MLAPIPPRPVMPDEYEYKRACICDLFFEHGIYWQFNDLVYTYLYDNRDAIADDTELWQFAERAAAKKLLEINTLIYRQLK